MADLSRQRRWSAHARTTDTFGRVLCNTRDQHFVVDGPVQNGCPGEAVTPGELFLTSIGACGVELIEVFARQEEVPLQSVHVEISGELDLDDPVRSDFTVFRTVELELSLGGVTQEQAEHLVQRFQGRCPLYGSMAVATPDVRVAVSAAR
jgi:uncharacterized OsmC-like protein